MFCDVCEDTFGRLIASRAVFRRHHHQSSYASLVHSATDDCFICSQIVEAINKRNSSLDRHSSHLGTEWTSVESNNGKESLRVNIWTRRFDNSNSSQEATREVSKLVKSFHAITTAPHDPSCGGEMTRLSTAFSGNTGSAETISQITEWIERCTETHDLCNQGHEETWMPSRLLEISDISGDLRVYLRDRSQLQCNRYLTLSHCWGPIGTQKLQLTTDSLEFFRNGFAVSTLKPAFRDMATLTWKLGLRLMWIDCMCIIQNDVQDWKKESASMGKVYANSWLNVSANSRGDDSAGLFADRNRSRLQDFIQIRPKESSEAIKFILTGEDTWWEEVENAPVNERAWVLQERILAPRIVHMSTTMALWECTEYQASEVFPDDGIPNQHSANNYGQLKRLYRGSPSDDPHDVRIDWNVLLSKYSMCGLTFETDRLIALSGIASEVHKRAKCDYVAGLWSTQLPLDLLWRRRFTPRGPRSEIYVAPSWSWASSGGLVWLPDLDYDYRIHATILGYETTLANPADKYGQLTGGNIKLRAPVGTLAWIGMRDNSGYKVQSVKILVPGESGKAETIEKWLPLSTGGTALHFDCEGYEDLQTAYFAVVRDPTKSYLDEITVLGTLLEVVLLRSRSCSRYERIGVAFLVFKTEQDIVSRIPIQDITIV